MKLSSQSKGLLSLAALKAPISVSLLALMLAACNGSEKQTATPTEEPVAEETATSEDTQDDGEITLDTTQAAEAARQLAADNLKASQDYLANNAKADGVTVLDSGLQYEVIEKATEAGDHPVEGNIVEVQYTGTLTDGTKFDSSRDRDAPARFPLKEGLIAGWIEGLQLMQEGDRFRFTIPPGLAYGEEGTPGGPIGPNQALIFDVELLKVITPEKNLAVAKAYLEENAKKEGITITESGLQYKVLSKGSGDAPSPVSGDIVTIKYKGSLDDGTSFATSDAQEFPVEGVFPGWAEAIQLMSIGDRFEFSFPPEIGYGEAGISNGVVGPNQVMIFDVELLSLVSRSANLQAALAFLEENASKEGIMRTESGLQYKVLEEGPADGAKPTAEDNVKVHYRGTLVDGTEFDSSYARNKPAEFPLRNVIPGWTEGLQLMKVGDKFQFFIPPDLGYGERGTPTGSIGPNEALIFEVELLEIQ